MGGFVPKPIRPKPKPAPAPAPPKPQPPKPTVVETTASQAADADMGEMTKAVKTKRKGRRVTILTDNEQLGGTSIAKKTLLG